VIVPDLLDTRQIKYRNKHKEEIAEIENEIKSVQESPDFVDIEDSAGNCIGGGSVDQKKKQVTSFTSICGVSNKHIENPWVE